MGRGCVSFILLCVAFRAGAVAMGATQAGEPIAVNVEYDVPAFGAKDAAVRAQLGADFDAKLVTKSSLRAGAGLGHRSGSPFSALALSAKDGDVAAQGTVVTVHVPSPSATAATLLAHARADAAFLEQLAKAQDLQEQRFLSDVGKATIQLHGVAGA